MKVKTILLNNINSIKDKRKKFIISVFGITKSIGVTHTSIMLAEYLRHKLRKKTAILEMTQKNDFAKMQRLCELSNYNQTIEKRFEIDKITFFREVHENETASILSEDFEYFILDLGSDFLNFKNECLRSDIKLALGSLVDWKCQEVIEFIKENKNSNKPIDFLYLMVFSNNKEISYLKRQTKVPAYSMPCAPDPFILQDDISKLFDKLI